MATYKSNSYTLDRSAQEVFEKFTDLTHLQQMVDSMPQEQRAQVGSVSFTPSSICISTQQVGDIVFEIKERVEPSLVVFGTQSSPVPLTMKLHITPIDSASCSIEAEIDVEIPAMLKPFIGPQIQKAADKFGELMSGLGR